MAHLIPAELRKRFEDGGQGHVFAFADSGVATEEETLSLVAQLSSIDVPLVNELFAETMAAADALAAAAASAAGAASAARAETTEQEQELEPPPGVVSLASSAPAEREAWSAAGLEAISLGRAAVLILAGGQGTRLGFDRPKGEYDLSLPSASTLFALQAGRIQRCRVLAAEWRREKEAGAGAGAGSSDGTGALVPLPSLPLYIMTSPMTDAETRQHWEERSYYGLPRGDVTFFCQGTLPCMTFGGKIMLETAGSVAQAPDGNGGIYRAAHMSGVVADLRRRGVVGVHAFAVDNAVVRAGDPAFLGFCMSRGADVGSKACPKAGPHEKVGVLCRRRGDGAYTVVEYSELSRADAERVDPATGRLAFNAGNICIHYFSTSFLETECSPANLPKVYHVARKAIPFAHPETGRTVTKAEMRAEARFGGGGNTGVKLESFIFDVFPSSRRMAVLEIEREGEFSPVKNAPGSAEDSPDTARALLFALHARWLADAGATVLPAAGGAAAGASAVGAPAEAVEVSPLASFGGEGLGALRGVEVGPRPVLVQRAGEPLPPVARQAGGGGDGAAAAAAAAPGEEVPVAPGVTRVQVGPVVVYRLHV